MESILLGWAVETIKDQLPELIGAEWPGFNSQLENLLAQLDHAPHDSARVRAYIWKLFRPYLAAHHLLIAVRNKLVDLVGESDYFDKGIRGFESAEPAELEPFTAYPRVDAPQQGSITTTFLVTVGFRVERDPTLTVQTPILIPNPPPGATVLVTLMVSGGEFDPPLGPVVSAHCVPLPLRSDAEVQFALRAYTGVQEVILNATYAYKGNIVGVAVRRIAITPSGQVRTTVSNPCRFSTPLDDSLIDLTVTVLRGTGKLIWQFLATNPLIEAGPFETAFEGNQAFATALDRELRDEDYRGPWAYRGLENIGQQIADQMPAEFFHIFKQVSEALPQSPRVLLLTNEPYVPWELALVPTWARLKEQPSPFLASQCQLGRWWYDDRIVYPPPATLTIQKFSVVASLYGPQSGQRELHEAVKERNTLVTTYSATGMEATLAALEPIVFMRPRVSGHLLHIATHGFSHPEANEQALLLADKKRLRATQLAGIYECGQIPSFAFVFCNACQVGMAGSSLGQAGGFPGHLIRGGTAGFIAPLWKVHDEAARHFAEAFYLATLDQDASVAAMLQKWRQHHTSTESLTPLAYVFYGHPALRLTRAIED